ncbi:alpha/beta hydrolase [Jatrophihabitans sp.]|uniref:alpha/beta hydrolase n=1 Tax=Jatrophihabitans sp. TaxID=1932789 RepID=UPI0030C69107|nr:putative lipase/esterase [Jatrophihabitans sp.]
MDQSQITYRWPADGALRRAVLVLPGGAYAATEASYEKEAIAAWLAERGIASATLDYRVAPHLHPAALQDARAALAELRSAVQVRSAAPVAVGVWGFSAGGHLAGLLATDETPRPDFLIVAYPIVSLDTADTHQESLHNLLGLAPAPALLTALSVDKRVDATTPQSFLVHSEDDEVVPPAHSLRLYSALRARGVQAELHVFRTGGHGSGLVTGRWPAPGWLDLVEHWIEELQLPPNGGSDM